MSTGAGKVIILCMKTEFERTALLLGPEAEARLAAARVTVAGLGGVGGACCEALARCGVGQLHIIDCDTVDMTNLNRQAAAEKATVGMRKTEAMRRRIAAVSDCAVTAADIFLSPETVAAVPESDFIVDCVDNVTAKAELARLASERGARMVSCMGTGNRLDPTRLRFTDVFLTEGDPLARAVRRELRKRGVDSLTVLVSDEPPASAGGRVPGSAPFVPNAAGLALASYVVRELLK